MRKMILMMAVTAPVLLQGCAQTTRTSGVSFTDPAYRGHSFSSLIVEADRAGLQEREAIEGSAAQALNKNGVTARTSLNILPPTRNYNDASVRQVLRQTGAQGVIEVIPTTKHIKQDYYPPSYYGGFGHGPYGNSFGIGTGFGFGAPDYYDPGYIVNEPQASYSVTLYALPNYTKVWTAEFRTEGPGGMDFDDVGAHFAEALIERMSKDGLIAAH